MTLPATPDTDDTLGAPLLRDPPLPPGYAEPLAGSSAENTFTQQASSTQHDGRPISVSTTVRSV